MAVAAGIEPTTCSLGESRSIQLSYATVSDLSWNSQQNERKKDFFRQKVFIVPIEASNSPRLCVRRESVAPVVRNPQFRMASSGGQKNINQAQISGKNFRKEYTIAPIRVKIKRISEKDTISPRLSHYLHLRRFMTKIHSNPLIRFRGVCGF